MLPFRFALPPSDFISAVAALAMTAICLAGCSSLGLGKQGGSVQGRLLHGPETFTGTATANITGNGAIDLESDKGVKCHGPYRQVPDSNTGEIRVEEHRVSSRAVLTCDDGRKGSVLFLEGRDEAVGTGMLGKDIVTLTIVE